MTRHFVAVHVFYADGSASQRLWPVTAERAEQIVAPLGDPALESHAPADARRRAMPAAVELATASVVVTRTNPTGDTR
ncbi:hypothetical protein [Verrucosispora sp. WMMC514]|uniref:hypothetical protein n=1 Tax=Verrucosispora sp. WMMC514 TaxID=3015156 RepID=UPI00248C9D6A|nr:hypothetical protein [Verrucosispora sp. WMMC514]WBB94219.1 hypothetical protein O7597_15320 [Verrucosispora sp. WMMC514]